MLRLELGIPADLIELASVITTQPTRPQLMRLQAAGLVSVSNIEKVSEDELAPILGDRHMAKVMLQELQPASHNTDAPPLDIPVPSD
jgi:hypothetical protein